MKNNEIKITLTEPQQRAFWRCIELAEDKLNDSTAPYSKDDIGTMKSLDAIKRKIVEARNAKQ